MMLEGVSPERIQFMSSQELRWLNNTKKAFASSDKDFSSKATHKDCLESMCKAIDIAKTLHRSLQDKPYSDENNRQAFVEFIYTEVPRSENNGLKLNLIHYRKQKEIEYGFAELVYDIRCMLLHENENLNVDEEIDYHILLKWKHRSDRTLAWVLSNNVVVNAPMLWERLRQHLAKFITFVDSVYNLPRTNKFHSTIAPPLGGIQPKKQNAT